MNAEGEYGLNVGRFLRDHPDHVLTEGDGGFGYRAWLKDGEGRAYGSALEALTLDELAAKLAESSP